MVSLDKMGQGGGGGRGKVEGSLCSHWCSCAVLQESVMLLLRVIRQSLEEAVVS